MTRFARASGSKSSNERLPEQATSWKAMKDGLEQSKKEAELNKAREKINEIRQKKYDEFVEEIEAKVEKTWAEFPGVKKSLQKNKSPAKLMTENDVTDEMIEEFIQPDAEIDAKVDSLQNQIELILRRKVKRDVDSDDASEDEVAEMPQKQIVNKKKLKNKKQPLNIEEVSVNKDEDTQSKGVGEDNSDSDDVPEETSAKILPKPIVNKKKQKNNKQPLKIEVVKTEDENKQPNKKNMKQKNNNKNQKVEEGVKKNAKNNKNQNVKGEIKNQKANQNLNQQNNKNKQTANEQNNEKQNKDNKNKGQNNKDTPNTDDKAHGQKRKIAKERDNEEHKRRKLIESDKMSLVIDGVEEKLVHFQGFPIRKTEADRLTELRKTMISKGIPKSEVERTLKHERRKAEKHVSRLRKKICYQCRKSGHLLSDCPELNNGSQPIETTGSGICFKCGSTEHSHLQCRGKEGYKFATCFICREQGHISRECPDNPRGLYPDGGACKLCGDVTHLKKDCPKTMQANLSNELHVDTISKMCDIESLENAPIKPKQAFKKQKVVTF